MAKTDVSTNAPITKKPTVKVPQLLRVKSSSIAEIGYADGALFVRFVAGKLYRYPGVSAEAYATLRNSESVGRALPAATAGSTGVLVPEADGA